MTFFGSPLVERFAKLMLQALTRHMAHSLWKENIAKSHRMIFVMMSVHSLS